MSESSRAYSRIVKECKEKGISYCDDSFPAEDKSIFYSKPMPRKPVWKRPKEIDAAAKFISDGATRFDIIQGKLTNTWFLGAVQSLTMIPSLLNRVVVYCSFSDSDYVGAVRFNFWVDGHWKEVIVDDRLPTFSDELMFMHSSDPTEFWSALLEKAYAKVNGSYEALKEGEMGEAMTDFTGGICEKIFMDKAPENMFKVMSAATQRQCLLGCIIKAENASKADTGLKAGVVYSITKLAGIKIQRGRGALIGADLVRLQSVKRGVWTGAWSNGADEWNRLSDSQKKHLDLHYDREGEFWMTYEDFAKRFDEVVICNLGPDSIVKRLGGLDWDLVVKENEWIKGVTAGGSQDYPSFSRNPQFVITLDQPEDGKCHVVIALMQKGRRKLKRKGLKTLKIGFSIYKVGDKTTELDRQYVDKNTPIAKSAFEEDREVIGRFSFDPGHYIIIPSTVEPHEEAEFLLRICSSKPHVSVFERPTVIETSKGDTRPPTEHELAFREKMFNNFQVLAGDDEEIDAKELQALLNAAMKADQVHIENNICKKILSRYTNLIDDATPGVTVGQRKMKWDHFKQFWSDLMQWRRVFDLYDVDKSGDMNTYELRNALSKLGFKLNTSLLDGLLSRFSNIVEKLKVIHFISIVITVQFMHDQFLKHRNPRTMRAEFSLEEFFNISLEA